MVQQNRMETRALSSNKKIWFSAAVLAALAGNAFERVHQRRDRNFRRVGPAAPSSGEQNLGDGPHGITGDRSLRGAFNMNVIRRTMAFLAEKSSEQISLPPIGKKGRNALKKNGWPFAGERPFLN
jgi:hypothetical protein